MVTVKNGFDVSYARIHWDGHRNLSRSSSAQAKLSRSTFVRWATVITPREPRLRRELLKMRSHRKCPKNRKKKRRKENGDEAMVSKENSQQAIGLGRKKVAKSELIKCSKMLGQQFS